MNGAIEDTLWEMLSDFPDTPPPPPPAGGERAGEV